MSYEYLNPERIKVFKLAKEVGRVPEFLVPLTPAEEDKVNQIHEESILFDFHNNPIVLPENMDEFQDYSRRGRRYRGHRPTHVLRQRPGGTARLPDGRAPESKADRQRG